MSTGGVPGPGECLVWGIWSRGGLVLGVPGPGGGSATAAGGMCPTGMHSC